MTTTLLTFAVVALTTIFYCEATTFTTCDFPYEKVGCFRDKENRALPEELVNDRDPTNPAWSGHMIDWKQYDKSLHSLACRCAAKAKAKGYKVFGLQFFGECWSGPGGENTYAKYGVANSDICYQDIYHSENVHCDKSKQLECIGGIWTNYVYRLKVKEQTPSVGVDGGYSEWSEWTSCTKTCGGGVRSRERTCDNPKPQGKGKDCSGQGPAAETEACSEQKCPVPCTKALDIGIILDGSTSVESDPFKVAIDFIKQLMKYFEISPQGSHVGFILYSTDATLEFKMSDSTYYSYQKLAARLDKIKYPQGSTFTDKALEMASNELFTPAGGDRSDKPNVLLVLTDGNTNIDSKPYSVVLAPLKQKKVRVIAVGIGNQINDSELQTIALGDPNYVVHVSSFYKLFPKLAEILEHSCKD
ncbi:coadhesin-like [Actinia tenebrosa]|uniref:Coadhesin-like n=1 Tax=Actinia tenebrosa TaxID=6105 RepID=A0A6P8I726_ACTTE|nr:coadhesin-like [Actinia tenebrosa]